MQTPNPVEDPAEVEDEKAQPKTPQWQGTVLAGTYRLGGLIGRGGIGEVYRAQHVRLPKRFAVKVLKAEFKSNSEAFMRFKREAELMTEIGHHHIVDVVDFNTSDEGISYIAMEYLEGSDLAARLEKGRMEPRVAVHVATQIADAVSAAHARGIVHRDLKPQNIFLIERDGDPNFVKVLDFGISKVIRSASRLTMDRVAIGTPLYMAPEQALGRNSELDARADQFSLAAILYEMLVGEPAFEADTLEAIMFRVVRDFPQPVHERIPGVTPDLDAVIARALAKRPEDRFASLSDFRMALLAVMGDRREQKAAVEHVAPPTRIDQDTTQKRKGAPAPAVTPRGGGMRAVDSSHSPIRVAAAMPVGTQFQGEVTPSVLPVRDVSAKSRTVAKWATISAGAVCLLLVAVLFWPNSSKKTGRPATNPGEVTPATTPANSSGVGVETIAPSDVGTKPIATPVFPVGEHGTTAKGAASDKRSPQPESPPSSAGVDAGVPSIAKEAATKSVNVRKRSNPREGQRERQNDKKSGGSTTKEKSKTVTNPLQGGLD